MKIVDDRTAKDPQLKVLHHSEVSQTLGSSIARMKLDFLRAVEDGNSIVHATLGNEAGDLDSVFSSIAHSLALASTLPKGHCSVPVINMLSNELALRKDVQKVLDGLGISEENLIFAEHLKTLDSLRNNQRLQLHLVDHNELPIGQEHLADAVVEILDHHVASAMHHPSLDPKNRTIKKCASTSSIVAEGIFQRCPEVMGPEVAEMLWSLIVVDTQNFRPGGPCTDLDLQIANRLVPGFTEIASESLYSHLLRLREDIQGLTVPQLLVKDLKSYRTENSVYGISSLPSSIAWLPNQDAEFEPALKQLSDARGLDFIIAFSIGVPDRADGRTIKFFDNDSARRHIITKKLLENSPLSPHLSFLRSEIESISTLYCSTNLLRKEFQPILAKLMK